MTQALRFRACSKKRSRSAVKRVSEKRLFVTPRGDIGYSLKTPYRDGTTHVLFEPLDLMAHIPVHHPVGRPAVVQIGNPADWSSLGWRRSSRRRA